MYARHALWNSSAVSAVNPANLPQICRVFRRHTMFGNMLITQCELSTLISDSYFDVCLSKIFKTQKHKGFVERFCGEMQGRWSRPGVLIERSRIENRLVHTPKE